MLSYEQFRFQLEIRYIGLSENEIRQMYDKYVIQSYTIIEPIEDKIELAYDYYTINTDIINK